MSLCVYYFKEMINTARKQVYKHLTPDAWNGKHPSPVTYVLLALIFFSLVVFSLETEPLINGQIKLGIAYTNVAIAVLFAVEYFLRLWCCVEDERYKGWTGRIKYMFTPMAIIDLVAFLPSLLLMGATSAYFLRVLRVFRLLRILKLGRYSKSIQIVFRAVRESWHELVVSLGAALFFLFISSVILYFAEADVQPEAFGSVLRALWWAVATLTTVGYGDVYPITVIGKICASIIALIGIAIVAIPTGILASRFMDEHKKQRKEGKA